jgi:hypothetical protein
MDNWSEDERRGFEEWYGRMSGKLTFGDWMVWLGALVVFVIASAYFFGWFD